MKKDEIMVKPSGIDNGIWTITKNRQYVAKRGLLSLLVFYIFCHFHQNLTDRSDFVSTGLWLVSEKGNIVAL